MLDPSTQPRDMRLAARHGQHPRPAPRPTPEGFPTATRRRGGAGTTGRARAALACLVALAALLLGASSAEAQQTAVCSETPGTGERIECTQPDTSSDQIRLTPTNGLDIDTTEDGVHGVHGHHEGTGSIFLNVYTARAEGGGLIRNDIDTTGLKSHGVCGRHVGSGNIDVGGQNLYITTAGALSAGVAAYHGYRPASLPVPDLPPEAAGNIRIGVSLSTIETSGDGSNAISATNHGGAGRIDIRVTGSTLTTLWDSFGGGKGIYAWRRGTTTGDVTVTVLYTNITTKGGAGHGVDVDHQGEDTAHIKIDVDRSRIDTAGTGAYGVRGFRRLGAGNIDIDVVGTDINTTGDRGRGINAYMYQNNGNIDVFANNSDITSTGEQAHGIYTRFQKLNSEAEAVGNIFVDVRGGSIETKGTFSYGIYGLHDGDGNITIDTRDGHAITTTGDNAHGIVADHYGSEDSRSMAVTVGGSVEASGAGAQGVRVGVVNADGDAERVAAVGADGYRQQTVTVNGRVYGGSGEGVGVFLAGGGRIYIGPSGVSAPCRLRSHAAWAAARSGCMNAPGSATVRISRESMLSASRCSWRNLRSSPQWYSRPSAACMTERWAGPSGRWKQMSSSRSMAGRGHS